MDSNIKSLINGHKCVCGENIPIEHFTEVGVSLNSEKSISLRFSCNKCNIKGVIQVHRDINLNELFISLNSLIKPKDNGFSNIDKLKSDLLKSDNVEDILKIIRTNSIILPRS